MTQESDSGDENTDPSRPFAYRPSRADSIRISDTIMKQTMDTTGSYSLTHSLTHLLANNFLILNVVDNTSSQGTVLYDNDVDMTQGAH